MLKKAADIAACAVDALLLEVRTWPKPGLVSQVDSGSHSDMDAALLERSARSLTPYFEQLADSAREGADLARLRGIGLAAEVAMLRATNGINTHRGAIFGLGLLCAAAGCGERECELGVIVQRRWGRELGTPAAGDSTHGAQVRRRYGVGGALAEAAAGFPHLYEVGWPALRQARQLTGGDEAAARVQCLFSVMAVLEDTNLLHRGGPEGLLFARALTNEFLQDGGVARDHWCERALRVHQLMVARNLSPGGSADLLAMTMFVDRVHSPGDTPLLPPIRDPEATPV